MAGGPRPGEPRDWSISLVFARYLVQIFLLNADQSSLKMMSWLQKDKRNPGQCVSLCETATNVHMSPELSNRLWKKKRANWRKLLYGG